MPSLRSTQSLVIVAGYVLGAVALYWGLPDEVPPSWTVSGGRAVWLGVPMVAFLLPTAVAITDLLLRGLYIRDPIADFAQMSVYDAIMLRFSIFVIGVHAAVLLAVLGLLSGRQWAAQIVPLMLGFAMISIGNILPKTRPNPAIGIRTRRTLLRPCALDSSAPISGIHGGRIWRGDSRVGHCRAKTNRAGDDSPDWARRTRGNAAHHPICRTAGPCLKRAPRRGTGLAGTARTGRQRGEQASIPVAWP